MTPRTTLVRCLAVLIGLFAALPAAAEMPDEVIRAELRPGWRQADGTHVAGLHLTLAPGWKTYWRSPGDAGIPPVFGWKGSRNLAGAQIVWPRPEVFDQGGMRAIGYQNEVVLPILVRPASGGDVHLAGNMQLGICKDVCVPHELGFAALLPAGFGQRDPLITAALSARPFTAAEIGGAEVRCEIAPGAGGAIALTARIDAPAQGGVEAVVVETSNPYLWVAEPESKRNGGTLVATTRILHMDRKPFALDRAGLTFTLLGKNQAVEIEGCAR